MPENEILKLPAANEFSPGQIKLFRVLELVNSNSEDKEAIISNLVENLMFINDDVQEKVIECLNLVNEELGNTIQKLL